ncbi:hypothetical protein SpCBS45565_g03318 [Spizellomyces sp. 'palustris']|nr:hypothetical protein SpCBS45565_g03318 [Spizellomyces sp. 'palustris']
MSSWETVPVNKRTKKEGESPAGSPRPSRNSGIMGSKTPLNKTSSGASGYFAALANAPLLDGSGLRQRSSDEEHEVTDLTGEPDYPQHIVPDVTSATPIRTETRSRGATPQPVTSKENAKKIEKKADSGTSHTEGLEGLTKLDVVRIESLVGAFVKKPSPEPVKGLAEGLDRIIAQQLKLRVPIFGKNFSLQKWEGQGPITFTPEPVKRVLIGALSDLDVCTDLPGVVKNLIELQKKALATGSSLSNASIGYALTLQLIASKYEDMFFEDVISEKSGRTSGDEMFETYSSTLGTNPAVGHSLIWICSQQRVAVSRYGSVGRSPTHVAHPAGLKYWMKFLLPLFSTPDITSPRGRTGIEEDSVAGSSVAISVQQAALDYMQRLLHSLDIIQQSKRREDRRKGLPSISVRDFVLLMRVAVSEQSALRRRKKGDEMQANIRTAYDMIKQWTFGVDTKPPLVYTNETPERAFTFLLDELRCERDAAVRKELLDTLTWIIASDTSQNPLRRTAAKGGKGLHSRVLTAWTSMYERNLDESRLLARRLTEEGKKRPHGKVWQMIRLSEVCYAVRDIKQANEGLLKRIAKRRDRERSGHKPTEIAVVHPDHSKQDLLAANRDLKALSTMLSRKPRSVLGSFLRTFLWIVLAICLSRSLLDVLCEPGSNRVCPLDDPRVAKFREQVWDSQVLPAYALTKDKVLKHSQPVLVPLYEQVNVVLHPAKDRAQRQWTQFKNTEQYRAVLDFGRFYVVPWLERVRQEWRDAMVVLVDVVGPSLRHAFHDAKVALKNNLPVARARMAVYARDARALTLRLSQTAQKEFLHLWDRLNLAENKVLLKVRDVAVPYWNSTRGARNTLRELLSKWVDGVDFLWRVVEDRVEKREWTKVRNWGRRVWKTVQGLNEDEDWDADMDVDDEQEEENRKVQGKKY